jgi:hypothetical protein
MGEESEWKPRAQENQGRWGKLPSRLSPSLATMGGGRKRTATLKRRTARKSTRKGEKKRNVSRN